jgi:site-specific recombinase XerD
MDIKGFLDYLLARGCSSNTLAAYAGDLAQFETFLKERKLRCTSVKPKLVQEYVNLISRPDPAAGTKLAPATVWRRLASLSTFYEWLRIQRDGKQHNPVKAVARPRLRRGSPKAIDETQLGILLEQVTDLSDKAIFSLLVASGLRLSELYQLNRDTITVERKQLPDGQTRVLGVGVVVGKGDKERTFLIDSRTLEIVVQYLRSRRDSCPALFVSNRRQRLSRREIQHIFKKWCRRLNLPDYHVHQTRHSYAQVLASAGIPSIVLKELMGHASFDTTQGYFRIKRQRLATEYFAAMELVNPSEK